MENDSGSKAAIAEMLRICGLAAGRPEDREHAAELILKTGHVLTQEEADKLLAQANRVATKSPTGLLWRWITLGEWRNILLDIKAAEEHLSRLGLERPKEVVRQERRVTSAPSHYSSTWVPQRRPRKIATSTRSLALLSTTARPQSSWQAHTVKPYQRSNASLMCMVASSMGML